MLFSKDIKGFFFKNKLKNLTYNLTKKLYAFLCKLYQISTTIYENSLLRRNSPKKFFKKKGSFKIKLNDSINLEKKEDFKLVKVNQYLNMRILNPKQLNTLIEKVFEFFKLFPN